jgi:uncharacterized phage protein (TIGR02218 family)
MSIPAWLTNDIVPIAWCWRIERSDGVTLGLTTHDRDLVIDGQLYRAAPGIRPSAIRQAVGLDGDRMDVEGALSADGLTEAELASGRWNGARLLLIVADWEDPDGRWLTVADGMLGEVSLEARSFSAELRGGDPWLNRTVAPVTSAGCRAALGDRRCRVALAPLRSCHRVSAVSGTTITVSDAPSGMATGRVRWLEGPMRGLWSAVLAQDGALLTLADPPAAGLLPDARVELEQGCDKRAETCRTRFVNILNFRGEPHLPGTDLLTRYPGG